MCIRFTFAFVIHEAVEGWHALDGLAFLRAVSTPRYSLRIQLKSIRAGCTLIPFGTGGARIITSLALGSLEKEIPQLAFHALDLVHTTCFAPIPSNDTLVIRKGDPQQGAEREIKQYLFHDDHHRS